MTEMKRPGRGLDHHGRGNVKTHDPLGDDMRRIPHRPPVRHGLLHLPLFQRAATREVPPFTTAGRYLYRRHHIPRELANRLVDGDSVLKIAPADRQ